MRKYCLTYDAKDSSAWEPDELKLKISKLLIENGAENVISTIASTILFECTPKGLKISDWNALFIKELKSDIFYYICSVGKDKELRYIDRNEGDVHLLKRFKKLLDNL